MLADMDSVFGEQNCDFIIFVRSFSVQLILNFVTYFYTYICICSEHTTYMNLNTENLQSILINILQIC